MKKSVFKPTITIVGAGLGGIFLAILFAKRGYKVNIYERYSEKELFSNSSRRSFNITFFGYGVTALKEVGLWKQIEPALLRLTGSATQLQPQANYIMERINHKAMPYYAVSRAGLLKSLVNAAKKYKNISLHFNTTINSIDRYAKTMTITNKSGTMKTIICDVIFGTDGINSTIRAAIQQSQDTNHVQEFAPWTYKQIAFSSDLTKKLAMKPNMPYSWTRKHAAIVGFPQVDGTFGALMMLPKNDEQGFTKLNSKIAIKQFVEEQFPILLPALKHITRDILNNPEGYFVTIRTSPWYYKDFMALVGDAAHGCLPFSGMGTSTAFGDCIELMKLVDKYGASWKIIFPQYQEIRKKNTDVIAQVSEQSLLRYTRFSKADRNAIFDKLEDVLSTLFPRFFLPPVFKLVVRDPNHSWELSKRHEKQRRVAKYSGISLAVTIVTLFVALQEKINQTFQ